MLVLHTFTIIFFLGIVYTFSVLLTREFEHKRKLKKFEDYKKFTNFIKEAIEQLDNDTSKLEASEFFLSQLKSNKDLKEHILKMDIEETKLEFYRKWGKHLPGYIEGERDRKIKSLGL